MKTRTPARGALRPDGPPADLIRHVVERTGLAAEVVAPLVGLVLERPHASPESLAAGLVQRSPGVAELWGA